MVRELGVRDILAVAAGVVIGIVVWFVVLNIYNFFRIIHVNVSIANAYAQFSLDPEIYIKKHLESFYETSGCQGGHPNE